MTERYHVHYTDMASVARLAPDGKLGVQEGESELGFIVTGPGSRRCLRYTLKHGRYDLEVNRKRSQHSDHLDIGPAYTLQVHHNHDDEEHPYQWQLISHWGPDGVRFFFALEAPANPDDNTRVGWSVFFWPAGGEKDRVPVARGEAPRPTSKEGWSHFWTHIGQLAEQTLAEIQGK